MKFLNISNRSLVETEYLLEVVEKMGFITKKEYAKLEKLREEIGIILYAFIVSIRKNL